jgi:hypothetical protein
MEGVMAKAVTGVVGGGAAAAAAAAALVAAETVAGAETVVGVDLASADSLSGVLVVDEAGRVADSLWGAEAFLGGGDKLATVAAALAAGDMAALAAPEYTHTQVSLGGPAGELITTGPLGAPVQVQGEEALWRSEPLSIAEPLPASPIPEWFLRELDARLAEVERTVGIRPRDPDPAPAGEADSLAGDAG